MLSKYFGSNVDFFYKGFYYVYFFQAPLDFDYYASALAEPAIRKAINVGNLTYHSGEQVEKHLINDVMDTVKPWVTTLMDNYKVRCMFIDCSVFRYKEL